MPSSPAASPPPVISPPPQPPPTSPSHLPQLPLPTSPPKPRSVPPLPPSRPSQCTTVATEDKPAAAGRRSPLLTEYDGSQPLTLCLDDEGSVVTYLPSINLPSNIVAQLEEVLATSESESASPPEDASTCSGSGRRQWFAEFPERPLGWLGPRRWRRASWRLAGPTQLWPLYCIRDAVEAAMEATDDYRLREVYNSVLVNRYPDGQSSIKWHSDDEKWYHVNGGNSDIKIGSVSLGAERWFELRSNPKVTTQLDARRRVRIRLRSGSLLVMAGATQQRWLHALPKDESCTSVRYNLTFRRVMTSEEDPRLLAVHERTEGGGFSPTALGQMARGASGSVPDTAATPD